MTGRRLGALQKPINDESGNDNTQSKQSLDRAVQQNEPQSPAHERQVDQGRQRKQKCPIRAFQSGLPPTQHEHAQHGNETVQRQRESCKQEHGLKARCKDKKNGKCRLDVDCCIWNTIIIDPGNPAQDTKILPHDLQYPRARHQHGTDGRDQQHRKHKTREAPANFTKRGFRCDQPHFDLALEVSNRCGIQEDEIQCDVQQRDDERPREQDCGQRALGVLEFTREIGCGVPARVGITDVDQGDGECAVGEERAVFRRRQKSYRLGLVNEQIGCQAKTNNDGDLEDREDNLETPAVAAPWA